MKNDLHLAFKTIFNFPLQISIYDSVKMHLADELRLIAMLPAEWPKLRGRELDRKNFTVKNVFNIGKHQIEHISFTHRELSGCLIDDKYFLSDAALSVSCDLELMLTPFAELKAKPMVLREWNKDYMGSYPMYFTLVESTRETHKAMERYYPVTGYELHGIDTLIDLMAYSYKFMWSDDNNAWEAITDKHLISKRIRKPWMQYLVQWQFGESPATEADQAKLISFLLSKATLTDEEREVCKPFIDRNVELEDIRRLGERQKILNKLIEAYNSDFILEPGVNILDDPFFAMTFAYAKR